MIVRFNKEELESIIKDYHKNSASQDVDVKIVVKKFEGVVITVSGERVGINGPEHFERKVEKNMLDGILYYSLKKKGWGLTSLNFDRGRTKQFYGVGENLQMNVQYELNGGVVVEAYKIQENKKVENKKR